MYVYLQSYTQIRDIMPPPGLNRLKFKFDLWNVNQTILEWTWGFVRLRPTLPIWPSGWLLAQIRLKNINPSLIISLAITFGQSGYKLSMRDRKKRWRKRERWINKEAPSVISDTTRSVWGKWSGWTPTDHYLVAMKIESFFVHNMCIAKLLRSRMNTDPYHTYSM